MKKIILSLPLVLLTAMLFFSSPPISAERSTTRRDRTVQAPIGKMIGEEVVSGRCTNVQFASAENPTTYRFDIIKPTRVSVSLYRIVHGDKAYNALLSEHILDRHEIMLTEGMYNLRFCLPRHSKGQTPVCAFNVKIVDVTNSSLFDIIKARRRGIY